MNKTPKISIVLPVYNAEKYLKETIHSILNQSFTLFELIIVNDGSFDRSVQLVDSFNDDRIVLINQKNSGISVALNNGIKAASTPYIARIDADDICEPERLWLQYEFLESHPDYLLVGSNARVIDKAGKYVYSTHYPTRWEDLKNKKPFYPIIHSSVMIRKRAIIQAGYYNEKVSRLNAFEDLLLWNQLDKLGKFANIQNTLISYRIVPNASTSKIGKDARITRNLVNSIITKNSIDESDIKDLQNAKANISPRLQNHYYHLYLGKKYLINSNRRGKALINLISAFFLSPLSRLTCALLLLSFAPRFILKRFNSES